jgi:hypothetical protein
MAGILGLRKSTFVYHKFRRQIGALNATSEVVCFSSNHKTAIAQGCVFPGEEK